MKFDFISVNFHITVVRSFIEILLWTNEWTMFKANTEHCSYCSHTRFLETQLFSSRRKQETRHLCIPIEIPLYYFLLLNISCCVILSSCPSTQTCKFLSILVFQEKFQLWQCQASAKFSKKIQVKFETKINYNYLNKLCHARGT